MKSKRIGFCFAVLLCSVYSATAVSPAAKRPVTQPVATYKFANPDKSWIAKTMKAMTLRDKVAQLIAVRVNGKFLNHQSREFLDLEKEVRQNRVGGVILFAGNVYESAVLLNDLQKASALPLLVSADFERGASFRIADTTSFPWTMALGAAGSEELAYREGAITAREARAMGVHWIYAPVMDVNNNPDNPVINIRSFGEDPQLVARLGSAYIRGARDNGVMTTAKHFPGHGDTATDTHIGLAVVASDEERLNTVELVPFRAAIAAGVDSIMTAHVAVPKITGESGTPATLSPKILTGLLRNTLHFKGLVVTDAMEMGGITTRFWGGLAAVRALQAGADLLLLPPDTEVAINEVVRAVERGDISVARIDQSVERVLSAKTALGLHKKRVTPLDPIAAIIASPESQQLAQTMAEKAITLVRDDQHLLPLNPLKAQKIYSLVLSSDSDPSPGTAFQADLRRRFPSLRSGTIDARTPDEMIRGIIKTASDSDIILCSTLVRVISGKGSLAMPENHRQAIEKLQASGKPVMLLAFGNPYVLRAVPKVAGYICSFSYADVSFSSVAKALSGEIAITGRMPVSIPEYARIGDGVQLPRLDLTLGKKPPQEMGLPEDAFRETEQVLADYVEKKAFPGAALVVGYRGSVVLDTAAGRLDYSNASAAVTGDTIYDLASVSKAVATTSAAMMLVESGRLLLNAPVQDYLPEFKGEGKEKIKVIDLLTHSAGLPAFKPLYLEAKGYNAILKLIFDVPLEYAPGTKSVYSDFSMILAGEIIARASARPLEKILADRLFGPLGMKSTEYRPAKNLLPRIAPTEDDPWRNRIIRGEVHDENAFAMGGVAGHAGLFSTAHDLAIFAQTLLNRGFYDHRRYFNPETIARFTALQGSPEGGRGLGWGKPVPGKWTERVFSPQAFGHTGFTGTSIWIDPPREVFIILLTNRVHPTRKNTLVEEARQSILEAVMRALTGPVSNPKVSGSPSLDK